MKKIITIFSLLFVTASFAQTFTVVDNGYGPEEVAVSFHEKTKLPDYQDSFPILSFEQNRGLYINGPQTIIQKITVGHQMNAAWLRVPFVLSEDFHDQWYKLNEYKLAGFKLSVTVVYNSEGAFATDTAAYKIQLAAMIELIHPDRIVVENEPTTADFHKHTKFSDYINELAAAATVCAKYGIPVSDGGMTYRAVIILADDVFTYSQSGLRVLANEDLQVIALEKKRKNITPNGHYYTADINCPGLLDMINYLTAQTGTKPIFNETGNYKTNPNPGILEAELNIQTENGVQLSIINSSPEGQGNAVSFVDDNGNIASGFADILKQ